MARKKSGAQFPYPGLKPQLADRSAKMAMIIRSRTMGVINGDFFCHPLANLTTVTGNYR
jgi:hypothetical protein